MQIFERPLASARARVGSISHGDWIRFDTVNLTNIESLTVGASSAAHGGTIEVRRDAPDGDLLARWTCR